MAVAPGTRLGAYEIRSPLGSGAMGEVYRAVDTRLKRQVAIKLLPPALAVDPDRLARFQREAEVLASLNHPHIAAIYGLEDADGSTALVMELVEGATLAERIDHGPLPVDEALAIARQIAEALEAAHEQGIIHRDLKPANIKVRDDGTVKVLDFGLAKLADGRVAAPAASDLTRLQTTAPTMSMVGVIMGTAAYMSPEQARGRPLDKRTDIWSFGAVLYEMLTGARAFAGEDVTETMAAVMKSTPDWTKLPADTPPHIVTLIQQCLAKDRTARIGDMAVARFLLTQGAAPGHAAVVAAPGRARWLWLAPALAAVVIGMLIGWWLPDAAPRPEPATHLQMGVAPADSIIGASVSQHPARTAFAISPDGRTVVFAGVRGSTTQLYLRELARAEATVLAGTEGATGPFYSPDGSQIGFWVGNTIKKISAAGGAPAVIADLPARAGSAASWDSDGSIYFESNSTGISKISQSGGMPSALTRGSADASTGERHLLPFVIPGTNALLYTKLKGDDWAAAEIVLRSLQNGDETILLTGGADARYANPSHLVYLKAGTLMAVAVDIRDRKVTGAPSAVIEGVMQSINQPNTDDETAAGQFAISPTGTFVYALGGIVPPRESELVLVNRKGETQALSALGKSPFYGPRLSPDAKRAVVALRRSPTSRSSDVWVYDLDRAVPTRVTFDGGGLPLWSPDGRQIVYAANALFLANADGSGTPQALTKADDAQFPSAWSPGVNAVTFTKYTGSGAMQIWALPMEANAAPRLFLESKFNISHPELSPDGRLLAYVSDESGLPEVYVQAYPDWRAGPADSMPQAGEKTRLSTGFGTDPLWTRDGKELLFRGFAPTGQQLFLSAALRSVSPLQFDAPRPMFEAKPGMYDSTSPDRSWSVSAEGQRFLLSRPVASTGKPLTTMNIVLNWTEELRRLAR